MLRPLLMRRFLASDLVRGMTVSLTRLDELLCHARGKPLPEPLAVAAAIARYAYETEGVDAWKTRSYLADALCQAHVDYRLRIGVGDPYRFATKPAFVGLLEALSQQWNSLGLDSVHMEVAQKE